MQRSAVMPPTTTPSTQPHLGLVVEMLDTLDTLTVAGQRHVMGKVLRLLSPASGRSARRIDGLLADMGREAGRMAPTAATFRRRAEEVLVALAAPG
jgi:hypothetical protein